MVTPWYGSQLGGGVAIAVENLARSLSGIEIQSLIVIPEGNALLPRFERGALGERIVRLPILPWHLQFKSPRSFIGYWYRLVAAFFLLAALIFFRGYRAAHLHYCLESYSELTAIFRLLGLPVFLSFHGSDVLYGFDSETLRPALHRIIRRARRVVTVSHGLRRELLNHIPPCEPKSLAVWNPVPLKFWNWVSGANEAVAPEIDFLYAGSLLEVKGADVLVDAFIQLSRNQPGLRMIIAGEGPLQESLRSKIDQAGLNRLVEFPGKIPYEKLFDLYRRTRIVVVPSRFEGFGFVAAEAALLGKPVVASSVGGLPEVVEDGQTGLLGPPGDPAKRAQALTRWLEDSSLVEKLGRPGRERAQRLFDPAVYAKRWVEIYRQG
jgi:glycogen(starch) synthase